MRGWVEGLWAEKACGGFREAMLSGDDTAPLGWLSLDGGERWAIMLLVWVWLKWAWMVAPSLSLCW